MPDSHTTALLASVEDYEKRLLHDPEAKNEPVEFAEADLPRLCPELRKLWLSSRVQANAFSKFAFAKHALHLCVRANYLPEVHDLLVPWLYACVDAGAHRDGRDFAGLVETSAVLKKKMKQADYFSVLLYRAKSFRNLGEFSQAQEAYRRMINAAEEKGSPTDVHLGMLLIGKLYGNYLGQRSLFSSFVEESLAGFEEEEGGEKWRHYSAEEQRRIIRCKAICLDALGQAYRDSAFSESDRLKVESNFLKALNINSEIGRASGISRVTCHLNHFMFKHAASPQDKNTYMERFKDGMMPLMRHPRDERGMGIRFVQFASMLNEVGQREKALDFLTTGKALAWRYSEFKTFMQATVVESEIHGATDPGRAIHALEEGRRTAHKYNLMLQETELNRRLAELEAKAPHVRRPGPAAGPFDLFSRNRTILMGLIREVQATLMQLDSAAALKPEFKRLRNRRKKRRDFRDKLLLDFEHIVERLDLNILSLLRTFNPAEHQADNLFEIVSSVTPLFLEDYEAFILADTMLPSLDDVAADAARLPDGLRQLKGRGKAGAAAWESFDADLGRVSAQVRELADGMRRLRDLLSGRIGQTELEGMVSLREVCERAVKELAQQAPRLKDSVVFRAECDVQIRFYHRILVAAVRNLLRSLTTAAEGGGPSHNRVIILLRPDYSRFSTFRKQFRAALLSAETAAADEAAARELYAALKGLEDRPAQPAAGAGPGLELARYVFKERIGAGVRVSREGNVVAVEIFLEADIVQVGTPKEGEA